MAPKKPTLESKTKVKTVVPKKKAKSKTGKSGTKVKTVFPKKKAKSKTGKSVTKVKTVSPKKKAKSKKVPKVDTTRILRKRRPRVPKRVIKSNRGVVYLSHVPHGFYEKEMKDFFSQFGQVTGIRIPKSKRTGKYKGYAFVEFMYPDVAKIAAETMNNYLMFKKVLKAKYLPPEEQKPYAFRFPAPKVPLAVRRKRLLRNLSNRTLTEEESQKEVKRVEKVVNNKLKKLKKLGINYEFQVANSEKTAEMTS